MSLAFRPKMYLVIALAMLLTLGSSAFAQQNAIDNELKLIDGHWRVIQLVENGQSVPESQMKFVLPGGGILEIIDETILRETNPAWRAQRTDGVAFVFATPRQVSEAKAMIEFNKSLKPL